MRYSDLIDGDIEGNSKEAIYLKDKNKKTCLKGKWESCKVWIQRAYPTDVDNETRRREVRMPRVGGASRGK